MHSSQPTENRSSLTGVIAGLLASALALGGAGEVTSAPMAHLPLLLIPAYLVPLFIMLHLAALFQGRRLARGKSLRKRFAQACAMTASRGA